MKIKAKSNYQASFESGKTNSLENQCKVNTKRAVTTQSPNSSCENRLRTENYLIEKVNFEIKNITFRVEQQKCRKKLLLDLNLDAKKYLNKFSGNRIFSSTQTKHHPSKPCFHQSSSFINFVLISFLLLISNSTCEESTNLTNYSGTYTAIAPAKLRPNSEYHVSLSVHPLAKGPIAFELTISGGKNYESITKTAKLSLGETRILKLDVGNLSEGEYKLRLVGKTNDNQKILLRNTTKLQFEAKSHSVFIQTDKSIYKPGQTILFRALILNSSLLPAPIDSFDIYLLDPNNIRVKQWNQVVAQNGIFSNKTKLSSHPKLGKWKIVANSSNHEFVKTFQVDEYVLPNFDVELYLPSYVIYNESSLVATVKAFYTYGKPLNNGEVTLTIQPNGTAYNSKIIAKESYQLKKALQKGQIDFFLNLVKDLSIDLGDNPYLNFKFTAVVEDTLTGRKYKKTKLIKIYNRPFKVDLINKWDIYKPGLPLNIQLKIAHHDDTPVTSLDAPLKVKYGFGYEESEFKNNLEIYSINGIAEINLFTSKNDSNVLNFNIYHKNLWYGSLSFLPMQSPSLNFIQITSKDLTQSSLPVIGQNVTITVNCTEPLDHLVYQVISRGDLVLSKSINFSSSQRVENVYNFAFTIIHRMSPTAKLIVYYIRSENKELVADSIEFRVKDVFRTPVTISTDTNRVKPGSEVQIKVKTHANALVAVLGLDQSTVLLNKHNDITLEDVIDELNTYDSSQKLYSGDRRGRHMYNEAVISVGQIFDDLGLIIITDGDVFKYGSEGLHYRSMAAEDIPNVKQYSGDDNNQNQVRFSGLKDHEVEKSLTVRNYFPETWLWATKYTESDGEAVFINKVPDTITSWIISAFAMDKKTGLGIAPYNAKLTVFRQFFIKINLPYSVIRGETVSIQILVYNYLNTQLEAEVTLFNDNQFNFTTATIKDQDDNQPSFSYRKKKVNVSPGDGASVSFLITTNRIGAINIRAKAITSIAGDSIVKTLLVKPEGETQFRNEARLINLKTNNTLIERINISIPNHVVAGSRFVKVSLLGDLIGTSLNHIQDLLRMPYGCGEQNMIHFVPNIVILDYLKKANKLTIDIEKKAMNFIEFGYQTELAFRRSDSSFSAFGNLDEAGSTWLTAFVLKAFLMARNYLPNLDNNIIKKTANWLMDTQFYDGSFDELGEVHYKPLQGYSADERASLTAFVLIAILQSKELHKGHIKQIDKTVSYLEKKLKNDIFKSTYELAIITYALHLANSSEKDEAYKRLMQFTISDNENLFWTNNISHVVIKSRLKGKKSDHFYLPSAVDIETASYGLLVLVTRNQTDEAVRVMRWLISKQNSNGGFVSTQDTVIALQALGAMASKIRSSKNSITCKFKFAYNVANKINKTNGNLKKLVDSKKIEYFLNKYELQINDSNSLELQQIEISETDLLIPENSIDKKLIQDKWANSINLHSSSKVRTIIVHKIPDYVEIEAAGIGTAVAHISWQYNLNVSTEESPFYLNSSLRKESNPNFIKLDICSYYKAGNETNMAVMEVGLPSGFTVDSDTLNNIKRETKKAKKVHSDKMDTSVVIYFDKIKNEQICLTVPAHRTARVANNKPVAIKLYDYYNRVEKSRIFYQPLQVNACDICEKKDCDSSCGQGDFGNNDIIENFYLTGSNSNLPTLSKYNSIVWLFIFFIVIFI